MAPPSGTRPHRSGPTCGGPARPGHPSRPRVPSWPRCASCGPRQGSCWPPRRPRSPWGHWHPGPPCRPCGHGCCDPGEHDHCGPMTARIASWAGLPAPKAAAAPEAGPGASRPGSLRPGLNGSRKDPVSFAPSATATMRSVRPVALACPTRCQTPRLDLSGALICRLRPVLPVAGDGRAHGRWCRIDPLASRSATTPPAASRQPRARACRHPLRPARSTLRSAHARAGRPASMATDRPAAAGVARPVVRPRIGSVGTRAAPGPDGRPQRCSGGPLAGDGPEPCRDRPAGGGSPAIAPARMLDGRGRVVQGRKCPPVSPMAGDQAGHPAHGSAAGARGPGSGSHGGGDPPCTVSCEHGCDPSPAAGPSLPPCGSRCQGVRIGGWRRAAMSVGVSPRGGDDLSCPGKGWWRVSMCHRRAPVVSSTGGGVLMGRTRPGSRSQTRGLRRADRVD